MRNLVDLNSNPLIPNGCRSCHVMERRDGGCTWTMDANVPAIRASPAKECNAWVCVFAYPQS
jgi:hypothetical protein